MCFLKRKRKKAQQDDEAELRREELYQRLRIQLTDQETKSPKRKKSEHSQSANTSDDGGLLTNFSIFTDSGGGGYDSGCDSGGFDGGGSDCSM